MKYIYLILLLISVPVFASLKVNGDLLVRGRMKVKNWVLDSSQTRTSSATTSSPSTSSSRMAFSMANSADKIRVQFYGFAFTESDFSCTAYLTDSNEVVLETFTASANSSNYLNSLDVTGTFTQGSTYYVVLSSPTSAMGFLYTDSSSSGGRVQYIVDGVWTNRTAWAKYNVYRYE
jgi:hypothetical protein